MCLLLRTAVRIQPLVGEQFLGCASFGGVPPDHLPNELDEHPLLFGVYFVDVGLESEAGRDETRGFQGPW